MESEDAAQQEPATPVVTIARYQDRIPTDKTPEQAAEIHGAGAVFVDGKCYADILREQKPVEDVQPTTEQAEVGDPNEMTFLATGNVERRDHDDPEAAEHVGERAGDVNA